MKTISFIILAALVLLVAGSAASQILGPITGGGATCCTYYVDQTNGSDSNSGRTPGAAWKTISKVNGTTLSPGQSVGFKRGETWRETLTPGQSGTAGSPITFTAYGSGAKPIIYGADTMTGWVADPSTYSPTFTWASGSNGGDGNARNTRTILAASQGSTSGTSIKITLSASSLHNNVIAGAAICVSTTGTTCDVTPTRITFSTANGATISAGTTVTSDAITYSFDKTVRHLINLYYSAYWPIIYQDTPYAGYTNYAGPDNSQSTTMTSADGPYNRSFGVLNVQVGVSGQANTWKVSETASHVRQVFTNGARGTERASKAGLVSNGDWYYDGSTTLYYYRTSDPSGFTIEASNREQGVTLSSLGYLTINALSLQKQGTAGIEVSGSNHVNIINSDVDLCGQNGIMVEYASSYVAIQGGIWSNNGFISGGDNNGIATGGLGNASSPITIAGVEVYGSGNDHIEIYAPSGGTGVTNITVSNAYLHGPNGTSNGGIRISGPGTVNAALLYNTISSTSANGITVGISTATATIYNNTIYGNAGQCVYLVSGSATVKNNICSTSTGYEFEIDAGTWVSDYNLLYHPAGGNYIYYGGNKNWAGYKTASSQDANSPTPADPLFTSPGTGDFTIPTNSPAYHAGTYIAGVSTSNPPSIGAK